MSAPLCTPAALQSLIDAATAYKLALVDGRAGDSDLHRLYNAGHDVFGVDELYDAARETAAVDDEPWSAGLSLHGYVSMPGVDRLLSRLSGQEAA